MPKLVPPLQATVASHKSLHSKDQQPSTLRSREGGRQDLAEEQQKHLQQDIAIQQRLKKTSSALARMTPQGVICLPSASSASTGVSRKV